MKTGQNKIYKFDFKTIAGSINIFLNRLLFIKATDLLDKLLMGYSKISIYQQGIFHGCSMFSKLIWD